MRFRGHPVHAAFVHFPLALLGTSLAFDVAGVALARPLWWSIAFWNVALGLALSVPALVTGLIDSAQVGEDSPAAPVVTRHLLAAMAALSCYSAALLVRGGAAAPTGAGLPATLALEAVGLALLMLAGWFGGELVYRHGIGATPESHRRIL